MSILSIGSQYTATPTAYAVSSTASQATVSASSADVGQALTATQIQNAASQMKSAVDSILLQNGTLGSFQNGLQFSADGSKTTVESLVANVAQIGNADQAAAMSELTQNAILAQAGLAVLDIANRSSQNVFTLLQ